MSAHGSASPSPSTSTLRRYLLSWVFSKPRWVNNVVVLGGFGLLFFLGPWVTMRVLGVQASAETAVLFRLYGTALMARAVNRYAMWGVPMPSVVLRGLLSDLLFSLVSAGVLTWAIVAGLAGATTWVVVGLFAVESVGYLIGYTGLRTVTRGELEGALNRSDAE